MPDAAAELYHYPYPRPAVTVDLILLDAARAPRVLLIRRGHDPFAGRWALPGGFVEPEEELEAAARRELREETSLQVGRLEQLRAYGGPGRDPRGWTITVAYTGIVDATQLQPRADDDADEVGWFAAAQLPPMAFDHDRIVRDAVEWHAAGRSGAST